MIWLVAKAAQQLQVERGIAMSSLETVEEELHTTRSDLAAARTAKDAAEQAEAWSGTVVIYIGDNSNVDVWVEFRLSKNLLSGIYSWCWRPWRRSSDLS